MDNEYVYIRFFFCYNRNSFLTTIIFQRYNKRAMTSITSYPERGTIFLIYSIVMFCVTSETSCGAAVVSNLSDRNGEDGNFSGGLVY